MTISVNHAVEAIDVVVSQFGFREKWWAGRKSGAVSLMQSPIRRRSSKLGVVGVLDVGGCKAARPGLCEKDQSAPSDPSSMHATTTRHAPCTSPMVASARELGAACRISVVRLRRVTSLIPSHT